MNQHKIKPTALYSIANREWFEQRLIEREVVYYLKCIEIYHQKCLDTRAAILILGNCLS